MASTANIMLNKSGDRSPCQILSHTEKILSLTVIYVNCSFYSDAFYQVEEVLYYFSFAESFYCEWVLNFIKIYFSASIDMMIRFFSFNLLIW